MIQYELLANEILAKVLVPVEPQFASIGGVISERTCRRARAPSCKTKKVDLHNLYHHWDMWSLFKDVFSNLKLIPVVSFSSVWVSNPRSPVPVSDSLQVAFGVQHHKSHKEIQTSKRKAAGNCTGNLWTSSLFFSFSQPICDSFLVQGADLGLRH